MTEGSSTLVLVATQKHLSRRIETRRFPSRGWVASSAQLSHYLLCHGLAELDTPLIEARNAPHKTLHRSAVLVKSQKLPWDSAPGDARR